MGLSWALSGQGPLTIGAGQVGGAMRTVCSILQTGSAAVCHAIVGRQAG